MVVSDGRSSCAHDPWQRREKAVAMPCRISTLLQSVVTTCCYNLLLQPVDTTCCYNLLLQAKITLRSLDLVDCHLAVLAPGASNVSTSDRHSRLSPKLRTGYVRWLCKDPGQFFTKRYRTSQFNLFFWHTKMRSLLLDLGVSPLEAPMGTRSCLFELFH